MNHVSFWREFIGKVGAPMFTGTLVACLLSGHYAASHGILMGIGLGMMGLGHWSEHHRRHGTTSI